MDCTGQGPAEGDEGHVCDPSYCEKDYWTYGGCKMSDGTCTADVNCNGEPPTASGSCP
jgi:hypothetical protein